MDVIRCPLRNVCHGLVGTFCDHLHYDRLIIDDADCYKPGDVSEANILFKYRKRVFTVGEQSLAYAALRPAAVTTNSRGAAAGPRIARQNGRDWVTARQAELLCSLSGISAGSLEEVIANTQEKHRNANRPSR